MTMEPPARRNVRVGGGPAKIAMKATRYYTLIAVTFFAGMLLAARGGQAPGGELRTVAAIRELSIEQTRQRIPVHLRAVVTFFDERIYSYFIQDDTAGIYLQFPTNAAYPSFTPGQLIDVTGVSSPGNTRRWSRLHRREWWARRHCRQPGK